MQPIRVPLLKPIRFKREPNLDDGAKTLKNLLGTYLGTQKTETHD